MYAIAFLFCFIIKYTKYIQNLFLNISNKITKNFSAAYFGNFPVLGNILQF